MVAKVATPGALPIGEISGHCMRNQYTRLKATRHSGLDQDLCGESISRITRIDTERDRDVPKPDNCLESLDQLTFKYCQGNQSHRLRNELTV